MFLLLMLAGWRSGMEKNVAVHVNDVGMRFRLNHERVDNLKEYAIKFLKRDLKYNEFWALKEINFKKREEKAALVCYKEADKAVQELKQSKKEELAFFREPSSFPLLNCINYLTGCPFSNWLPGSSGCDLVLSHRNSITCYSQCLFLSPFQGVAFLKF